MHPTGNGDESSPSTEAPDPVSQRLDGLRKTLLRHGHAQELFQQRVDSKIDYLTQALTEETRAAEPQLSKAQLQALVGFDQALGHLLALSRQDPADRVLRAPSQDPGTLREGLDLLQIRVRNLQHSFGLEIIPTLGQPFDDQLHRADSTCCRPDLDDGEVVEELVPGYTLKGQVTRPALVIVNKH